MLKFSSSKKPKTIDSIAARAFACQTRHVVGEELRYAKPDVNNASIAFDAYIEEKTPAVIENFKVAVATCVLNNRSGFKEVLDKLNEIHPESTADKVSKNSYKS